MTPVAFGEPRNIALFSFFDEFSEKSYFRSMKIVIHNFNYTYRLISPIGSFKFKILNSKI